MRYYLFNCYLVLIIYNNNNYYYYCYIKVLGFMSKIQDYENKVDAMRHILLTNSDTSKVDSTM